MRLSPPAMRSYIQDLLNRRLTQSNKISTRSPESVVTEPQAREKAKQENSPTRSSEAVASTQSPPESITPSSSPIESDNADKAQERPQSVSLREFVLTALLENLDLSEAGLFRRCRNNGFGSLPMQCEVWAIRNRIFDLFTQPAWFHNLLVSQKSVVTVGAVERILLEKGAVMTNIAEKIRVWKRFCIDKGGRIQYGKPACEFTGDGKYVSMRKHTIKALLREEIAKEQQKND